nr:F-box/LRR-repeat protein At3g03360-like [Coffea arabica]
MYGIDRLADEILIVILSRLTLKEAVRASVISRGWRYLWQFTSGRLELKWNSKCRRTEFVRWVDQVVKLHQGPSVDEFIVHCHTMGLINADSISNWVHFAVQKDVRVFDLAISGNDFPDLDKFLSISNALKSRRNGFFSLTSLKLDHANVKDEMIEYFLANCPHLEHLCIKYERYLKNLNVVCPSLKSLRRGLKLTFNFRMFLFYRSLSCRQRCV